MSDGTAIEDVAYLCRWHVPSDAKAPRMTLALKAFKDADALDRWRIGDLSVRYLRLERSHALVEPARRLWAKTASVGLEEPRGAFEAVMRAGVELGLVAAR